jgi:hypothetical protein
MLVILTDPPDHRWWQTGSQQPNSRHPEPRGQATPPGSQNS